MPAPPEGDELERATVSRLIDQSDNVIRLVSAAQGSLADVVRKTIPRMDPEQQAAEEATIAERLVARIQAQDRSAEGLLVQRYQQRLRYVLLRNMPQQPEEVDDVLQTTMATVIVRLRGQSISNPSQLGGFIYGVAKNLMRASRRERERSLGNADPDILNRLADESAGPDQVTSDNETTAIVRRLLAELGDTKGRENYADVLTRLYIDQQDRDEICQALNLKPKDLRNALHRAKKRLKELWNESEEQTS